MHDAQQSKIPTQIKNKRRTAAHLRRDSAQFGCDPAPPCGCRVPELGLWGHSTVKRPFDALEIAFISPFFCHCLDESVSARRTRLARPREACRFALGERDRRLVDHAVKSGACKLVPLLRKHLLDLARNVCVREVVAVRSFELRICTKTKASVSSWNDGCFERAGIGEHLPS